MSLIRQTMPATVSQLGDDEVEVIIATGARARDGHMLDTAGLVLDHYQGNPIVLWQHDPKEPVGNADEVRVVGATVVARVKFAPVGISETADKVRGLVKAGVVRAVSVGFEPLAGEPLDPQRPRGGQRFTAWDLLEFSFVTIPADVGALVTARATESADSSKEVAGMADEDRGLAALRARMIAPASSHKRGLSECAQLAWVLCDLGYLHEMATWEAEWEGDGSMVPMMLGEALKSLGEALIAMTSEEVNELLAGADIEPDSDGAALPATERAERRLRAWRRALGGLREGPEVVPVAANGEGASNDAADFRRRQAELLKLAAA